jgi:hypothetical protein
MIRNQIIILLVCSAAAFCLDRALEDHVQKEWAPGQFEKLLGLIRDAEARGLPVQPLEDKAWEGLSKNVPAEKILEAVGRRRATLEAVAPENKKMNRRETERRVFALEKKKTEERMAGGKNGQEEGNPQKAAPVPQNAPDRDVRFRPEPRLERQPPAVKAEKTAEKQETGMNRIEEKQEKAERKDAKQEQQERNIAREAPRKESAEPRPPQPAPETVPGKDRDDHQEMRGEKREQERPEKDTETAGEKRELKGQKQEKDQSRMEKREKVLEKKENREKKRARRMLEGK